MSGVTAPTLVVPVRIDHDPIARALAAMIRAVVLEERARRAKLAVVDGGKGIKAA